MHDPHEPRLLRSQADPSVHMMLIGLIVLTIVCSPLGYVFILAIISYRGLPNVSMLSLDPLLS